MGNIKIILGALILFLPTFALAAVLFDNGSFSGPQAVRNNMCAQFDDGGNCTSRFTIYDQFVLEGDSVVTGFEWHQTEQKPENYLDTLLTIGSGVPSPGSLLYTFQVMADRSLSSIPVDDPRFDSIPAGSFEALASVSGLGIELAAGNYWLGIHNAYPQFGGSSQWSQTSGTVQTIAGRWQGEGMPCGAFPSSPDGGCLKFFPGEDSAFRVIGRITVSIDIKPGSDPNSINPSSKGVIPVAVLGSGEFYAPSIDFSTVTFGLDLATPAHDGHVEDVNDDGFMDMMFHFKTQKTGIVCGDAEATLIGKTFDGIQFTGTDAVKTSGCNGASIREVTSTKGVGAMSWIFLVGLSVLGLWRRNR